MARLAASGMRGLRHDSVTRGRQRSVVSMSGLFCTVTAQGEDAHFIERRGVPRERWRLCPCTPPREPASAWLATWNAQLSHRWRMVAQRLRRELGPDIEYFRVQEVQDRGALHIHFVIRRRGGGPLRYSKADLRRLALSLGFGHEVDVQPYGPEHAGYVAKYVSKSADQREDVPWNGARLLSRKVYRPVRDADASVRDTWTSDPRDWGGIPYRVGVRRYRVRSTVPTYRTWVASRGWGDKMSQVRADQAHWGLIFHALPEWALPDGDGGWVPLPQDERHWLDDVPDRRDGLGPPGRTQLAVTACR